MEMRMKRILLGLTALLALSACTKQEIVRNKQSGVPAKAVEVLPALSPMPTMTPAIETAPGAPRK